MSWRRTTAGLAPKIYDFNILIIMYIKGYGHDMLCIFFFFFLSSFIFPGVSYRVSIAASFHLFSSRICLNSNILELNLVYR